MVSSGFVRGRQNRRPRTWVSAHLEHQLAVYLEKDAVLTAETDRDSHLVVLFQPCETSRAGLPTLDDVFNAGYVLARRVRVEETAGLLHPLGVLKLAIHHDGHTVDDVSLSGLTKLVASHIRLPVLDR
jgi:hypothetical protein